MTAYQDVYPQVPPSPSTTPDPTSERGRHRDSTASGANPLVPPVLLGNSGAHTRARRSVVAYLAAVLLPLIGVLLVLYALSLFGRPPTAEVIPPVQVAVSPSACTFPDGS